MGDLINLDDRRTREGRPAADLMAEWRRRMDADPRVANNPLNPKNKSEGAREPARHGIDSIGGGLGDAAAREAPGSGGRRGQIGGGHAWGPASEEQTADLAEGFETGDDPDRIRQLVAMALVAASLTAVLWSALQFVK